MGQLHRLTLLAADHGDHRGSRHHAGAGLRCLYIFMRQSMPAGIYGCINKTQPDFQRIFAIRQVELNLYEEVLNQTGTPVVFNISVLGALLGMYPVVKKESVLKVLADKFPPSFMEGNTKALELGFTMGSRYLQ